MRGDRLRWARERMGLSQRDLALRCGLGERQIWRYENGDTDPNTSILITIAKELSVTSDFLLGLADDPKGEITEDDLSEMERKLIAAFRNGQIVEALNIAAEIAKSGS